MKNFTLEQFTKWLLNQPKRKSYNNGLSYASLLTAFAKHIYGEIDESVSVSLRHPSEIWFCGMYIEMPEWAKQFNKTFLDKKITISTARVWLVEYFEKKFAAIPDEMWTTGDLDNHCGKKCALGHLDTKIGIGGFYSRTDEALALELLYSQLPQAKYWSYKDTVWKINDSPNFGAEPKERILNALAEVKKLIRRKR